MWMNALKEVTDALKTAPTLMDHISVAAQMAINLKIMDTLAMV